MGTLSWACTSIISDQEKSQCKWQWELSHRKSPGRKAGLTNQNGRRVAGQLSIPKQVRAKINLKSSRVRGVRRLTGDSLQRGKMGSERWGHMPRVTQQWTPWARTGSQVFSWSWSMDFFLRTKARSPEGQTCSFWPTKEGFTNTVH